MGDLAPGGYTRRSMLSSLVCVSLLLPQGLGGDEQAPVGLAIAIVEVDQGSAAVVRAPNGAVHVIDAGSAGMGNLAVGPMIAALAPTSYGNTFATHFHTDHIGGLDEVLNVFPFQLAYDRGDQNRSSNAEISGYLAAAGSRRRTAVAGQSFQLGGGATLRVIAANGQVVGGTSVPVAGTAQEENSRSIAMRIDYGAFALWIAGDLTGGGLGSADVESPASLACGDVDVYIADHHGSNTSTNANLVNRLAPEVGVFSAGSNNTYGHPTTGVLNLLNQPGACRVLLGTTEGSGNLGFGVTGHCTIATDGTRYRATAANGEFLDLFVDEVVGRAPGAGSLRISELHRDPQRVPDANGEYLELTNIGVAPVSLNGVQVVSQTGTFTFAADLALFPGRPVILLPDGHGGRNGGLPLGVVWPYQAIGLSNSGDTLTLRLGTTQLEQLTWTSAFPGGSGVAAERKDLLGTAVSANFTAATPAYGLGDRGTPARRNAADTTVFPALVAVEPSVGQLVLRGAALSHGGKIGVFGLALGNTGFSFLGQHVPLDPDALLIGMLGVPGAALPLPLEGYRSFTLPLPVPSGVTGLGAFAAHLVFDPVAGALPAVSTAVPLSFP